MPEQRMTAEARRTSIVKAVLPLFARKGFANTTTKELAETAGVSEALLYKHFPSKELLYSEILKYGCQPGDPALERINSLEPSTSTLVHIVYYIMRCLLVCKKNDPFDWNTKHRLVLQSCLEDGEFPRFLFQSHIDGCSSKIEACLDAAAASGDLVESPVSKENRLRFAHHLACILAMMHLPEKPIVDYKASFEELLNQAVWFVLRGMGLTDKAIATHFNPSALSLFMGDPK